MAKPTRSDRRNRLWLVAMFTALISGVVGLLAAGAFADVVDATLVGGSVLNPSISEGGSFSETISYSIHDTNGKSQLSSSNPATVDFALSGAPSWVHLSVSSLTFTQYDESESLTVSGTAPAGSSASSPYTIGINPTSDLATSQLNVTNGDETINLEVVAPTVTDTTAPTINFSASPDGKSGWFKTAPATMQVTATDSDDGGVASLSCNLDGSPVTLTNAGSTATTMYGDISTSADGDHAVSCRAADSSNNTAMADGDLKLDTAAPTVSGAPTTDPNGNGWYNSSVVIGWACSDTTSGVVPSGTGSCPADSTISTQGADQTVNSGPVSDIAGNSGSADSSPGVSIDTDPPTVSCTPPTPDYPEGGGWYAANQSVSCQASDGLSGLADSNDSNFTLGPTTIADGSYGSQQLGPEDVSDAAGNSETTGSFTLQIDRQAPTISDEGTGDTPTGSDGTREWYDHAVAVGFSASDGGSGLASCSSPWTAKTSGAGLGVTASSGACADNVGNTNPGISSSGYNVDTVAPTVAVTGPTDGGSYTLGNVPTAGCNTSDTLSGVATAASVEVTGGTADGVGTYTATCSGAADHAGNTADPVSITYSVAYRFSGFLAPVNNPKTINTGKAGRTYPVKWQLTDVNENYISDLGAVVSVTYASTSCGTFTDDSTDALETTATGDTTLRYDSTANQYVYNWATSTKGCFTLFLKLNDGTTHDAYFSLS